MADRAKEIRQEIARLQVELGELSPMETMSVREFAKVAGLTPAMAHRIKRGEDRVRMTSYKRALPFMGRCPLCKQRLPDGEDG